MNQTADCTVLIAAPDLLQVLKTHSLGTGELLPFSDTDALRALETISRRRPRLVALERGFAATSRGAALINRIKADPALSQSEIRLVSRDSEAPRTAGAAAASPAPATAPAPPPAGPAPLLDPKGTRRAPRYKIAAGVEAEVNGNAATIVDLSTVGVQVLSATILKPNQKVRVTLVDPQGQVRCQAVIAWAAFEIPPGKDPRYRAGIEFLDANAAAVDAFRIRHQSM